QYGDIGWPEPGRVLFDRDRGRRECDKPIEDRTDRAGDAARDVEDLAGKFRLGDQFVGPHDIAYVQKIPLRVEIPNPYHRFGQPRLDLGNLAGEAGDHEVVALAGPDMVERADPDDSHAVA